MSNHKHNSIDYVEFSGKDSNSITQIKNLKLKYEVQQKNR